jgi:hypothetical protein
MWKSIPPHHAIFCAMCQWNIPKKMIMFTCSCSCSHAHQITIPKGWPISPHDACEEFQWSTLESSNIFIAFLWCNALSDLLCCYWMSLEVVEMFITFMFIGLNVFHDLLLVFITLMFIVVFFLFIILMFMFCPLQVFITIFYACSSFWCLS